MTNCAPDVAKSSPLLAVRPPDLVTRQFPIPLSNND
jgi:hypothetical protein